MKRKLFLIAFLALLSPVIFAQNHLSGKMMIMGWGFIEEDSALQTNNAIDAFLRYAEAARLQTTWDENDNPAGRIELYEFVYEFFYDYEAAYISINVADKGDVLNRFIEIDFYTTDNYITMNGYKLVFSYSGYKWQEDEDEKGLWNIALTGDNAYNFFRSWLNGLRQPDGRR